MIWLYRVLLSVVLVLRLYRLWCWLYTKIYEREYREYWFDRAADDLKDKYDTFADGVNDVCRLTWQADGLREMGEVMRDPGWVLYNLEQRLDLHKRQLPGALDCGTYSRFLTCKFKENCTMSVSWMEGWKAKGHAVSVRMEGGVWWHGSNWGLMGPYRNWREVVQSIARNNRIRRKIL